MNFPFFSNKHKEQSNQTLGQKIPQRKESLQALWRLVQLMLSNLEFENVSEKVVNSILDELGYLKLGYKIIVLALVNENMGYLERVAISETQEAKKALEITPVPFKEIKIPLNHIDNLSIKALLNHRSYTTHDWFDILRPVYTLDQAKIVQKAIGIKASMVFPISFRGKPTGILIFSMNKDYGDVTDEEKDLIQGFVDLVGLTVQNSILYTSLRSITSQLQITNVRLQELDRLKDEFVSVASHELRTPMAAIKSYAWMALNRSDVLLTEKMKKYLSRIFISTERLINLVNDMLNVSRIESGHIEIDPKAFDIVALVKDVMEEVKIKALEKKLQLITLEQKVPQVFADPDKVHEILLNLIGNALKFTFPGGQIIVDFFTDGKMIEISVQDNGAGIAREDLGRLFKKFGRLDSSYTSISSSGGTGLGLYISKSLVELMHGSMKAASDGVDKGATFTFSLPVAGQEILSQAEKYQVKPKGEVKGLEPVAI